MQLFDATLSELMFIPMPNTPVAAKTCVPCFLNKMLQCLLISALLLVWCVFKCADNLRVVSYIHLCAGVSGTCLLITTTVQHFTIILFPPLDLLPECLFKGEVYFAHYLDLHGMYSRALTIIINFEDGILSRKCDNSKLLSICI